jgi:ketosteroid isomerase-like protein
VNAERKKQLVREFFDLFATRDGDAILARMTDDPTWEYWGQPRRGHEGVLSILKASCELYREGSTRREYQAQYVDGNTVISQSTMSAVTFKGEDYENRYITFVHLEGDKVARVEEYLDSAYANEKFSGWEES